MNSNYLKLRSEALVLTAGLLVMTGCANGQFGAGGSGTVPGKKAQTDKSGGESLGKEESEDEKADEPVQVSGAYLTCTADDSLEKEADSDTGVGCAVFDKSGRKDVSSLNITYTGYDGAGTDLGLVFKPSTGNYDTTTSLAKTLVSQTTIKATYADKSGPVVLESKIGTTSPEPVTDPVKTPIEKIFGTDVEYHVGNGNINFSQNLDCNGALQTINDGDIKLIVKFDVPEGGADISVVLSDMCGLQFTNNFAVFSSGVGSLDSRPIPPNSSVMDIPAKSFSKGSYTFEIRAGLRSDGQDYDDFIIGKMTFKANADVIFHEPYSKK